MSQKPVIPDGKYTLRWGGISIPDGFYATASFLPGEDVIIEAKGPTPGKTQIVGLNCILLI
jgi:hypothetical protein